MTQLELDIALLKIEIEAIKYSQTLPQGTLIDAFVSGAKFGLDLAYERIRDTIQNDTLP